MAFIGQFVQKFFGKQEVRVLTVGLDASGKTTILYKMKLGEIVTTIPTIGFNVETIQYRDFNITMWDVGGCDKIRPLYRHYFQNTQALIWVVDSNDRQRMDETKDEFLKLTTEDELRDSVMLIFANKQDLPNAMSVAEITDKMGLHSLRNRQWYIQSCCATTGDGLYEGFEWMVNALKNKKNFAAPTPPPIPAPSIVLPTPAPASSPPKAKAVGKSKAKITKEEKEKAREAEQEALFLKWLVADTDTTEEFLASLEAGTLSTFDHRTLLRMIWGYIKTAGRRVAIKKIFEQIPKYHEKFPLSVKANDTWTYFWIQLVHYGMEVTRNPSGDFAGFLFMNPLLLNQRMPFAYYKKKTILGTEAAKNMVLPDKRPLPSIVPKAYNPAAQPQTTPTTATQTATTNSETAPSGSAPAAADEATKLAAKVEDIDLDDKLTDDEFIQAFEECNLHKWDHRTHLRVAWTYITKFGRKVGSDKIFKGIENFILNSKISRKTTFHVTMTYFWLTMVDVAINSLPQGISFDEFMKQSPQLMDGGLFLQYYKKETMLNNIIARKEFVLPDIKPLPSIVIKK